MTTKANNAGAGQVEFAAAFRALTGCPPFPWQEDMYDRFVAGKLDDLRSCNLPTGLGKTSIIAIWLIGLGNGVKLPRRLAYVVNRRTVVDQSTNEAKKIRQRLTAQDRPPVLAQLANRLDDLASDPGAGPLAISTLRGQFADKGEWLGDPARPAIVVGTVDMVGSRLLFSGYGVGFKAKPLHAGFLGQDTLLVHDEAHLEPAFQKLIEDIEREQIEREGTGELHWHKLRVMALSATTRGGNENGHTDESKLFGLTASEKQPPDVIPNPPTKPIHQVWKRLKAKKSLRLHEAPADKLAEKLANLALEHKNANAAVLIYVRTIDQLMQVCAKLADKKLGVPADRIQQLTGTMRGHERDELLRSDPVFARFMPASESPQGVTPIEGTVYLVCTSAGEVGVNISADHMVCDLSTFESMAQRLGRVNRFGRGDARVDVVHPEAFDEKDRVTPARQATLYLLQQLRGDACPLALGQLDPDLRTRAFAPEPTILPVTDILFDAWALTTITTPMPGRPEVSPFLHGLEDDTQSETYLAWREEVWQLRDLDLTDAERTGILDDYPLKPHELLRDSTFRKRTGIRDGIAELANRCGEMPVWIQQPAGEVRCVTLAEAADLPLRGRTLILPPDAGGLKIEGGRSKGLFDPAAGYDPEHRHLYDIADQWQDDTGPLRKRVVGEEPGPAGMIRERSIRLDDPEDDEAEPKLWSWYVRPRAAESACDKASEPYDLKPHLCDAANYVKCLVDKLGLPDDLAKTIILAARVHDLGKARVVWQRGIGNRDYPKTVWAKSGNRARTQDATRYRHEFGSLLDAQGDPEFQKLDGHLQDLVLHLIAAHHGRARPHFTLEEAYDLEPKGKEALAAANEVPRRFARLQRRYGRWGLAYLESLLRAADWAVSARMPSRQDEKDHQP